MNIEVAIIIDGESIRANSDLQSLLEKLIGSYIKQNFLMGKKLKVTKIPRNPNAPKKLYMPKLTPEEDQKIIDRAKELGDTTLGKATKIISQEIGRSPSVVYSRLNKVIKAGQLTFTPSPLYYHK